MNKLISLVVFFYVSFCSVDSFGQSSRENPVMQVILTPSVTVHWDVEKDEFVRTENFAEYKGIQDDDLIQLIQCISDTTFVENEVCSKRNPLVKGDLAFLFLQEIDALRVALHLKKQFDHSILPCRIPENMLNWLEDNRNVVVDQLTVVLVN